MTKDPICGMTVDEATGLSAQRGGETFYFCSEHCRKKFLAQTSPVEPAGGCCGGKGKPNDRGGPAPEPAAAAHSCCGGHDHHDRAPAAAPSDTAKYICPMCHGVASENPDDCPRCGMALERNPAWRPTGPTIYPCPTHPGVHGAPPGDSPNWALARDPVTASGATGTPWRNSCAGA